MLGKEIDLTELNDYANLNPEIIIEGVDRNLCVFAPLDNTEYFIGKSYFENAYELFKDADKQYSSVLWEYEGGELAIDADEALFRKEKNVLSNKVEYVLPEGKKRLYRTVSQANIVGDNKLPMNVFAPTLRDSSYWQGLNNIKRNIELTLGLSYGVISEPTSIAMTATEIVSSKQRYYTTIRNFQNILISAFTEAIQNMIVMLNSLDRNIAEDYDLQFNFDDGILTTTKEKVDELAVLLNNQIITVEEARQNYFEKF
jgi:A118 family predicted phage portal protein